VSTPERNFRDRLVAWLKQLPRTVVFSIQQVSIRGTADLICCINGKFVSIEVKASEDAQISALQRYNLEKVVAVGGGIALIISPEGFKKAQVFLSELATGGATKAPDGTIFN